ncbi:MAG: ATP-binding protein [Paludibacteraceae bacterium]|nr:ATP-binding protein [Paludibacteraceae bacterium]
MAKKELLKTLIALTQAELPFNRMERDVIIPENPDSIITVPGVRRAGKSSLLMLAVNKLLASGVKREQILWVNFDDERLSGMQTEELDEVLSAYREMFPDVNLKEVYMFFDEIQNIIGWDLFVLRVFKSYCPHVYVTGSNAKLLSKEISTALRGWTLDYEMLPLSFSEYCRFTSVNAHSYLESDKAKRYAAMENYLHSGAFPQVVLTPDKSTKLKRLQGYFNTMLLRDLAERHKIKNIEGLRYFLKRIMLNLTKTTSINGIFNDMRSSGANVNKDDLYDWAEWAVEVYMFVRYPKYSASLVKENQSLRKYYVIDTGMRQAVLMPQSTDNGKLLENLVALDLFRRRGEERKIFYWMEKHECDFVVQREDHVEELIQVTWDMTDEETYKREIEGIKEAARGTKCDKLTIVTRDQKETIEEDGYRIEVVGIEEWLIRERCLSAEY